jgi:uncharacterized protein (TIGR02246 family)
MKKLLAIATFVAAVALGLWGQAALPTAEQAKDKTPAPVAAAGDKSPDEKAVLKTLVAYKEAFNRGDADGVAAFFTDEAELVNPTGETIRGRDAIRREFSGIFQRAPGVQLELVVDSMRWLTADAIVEHGAARTTLKGEPAAYATYTAVHVKQSGKWLISMVREAPAGSEPNTPEEKLAGLAWLIGEWRDGDESGSLHFKCDWSKHRSFLMRTFTVVSSTTGEEIHGTEIIGWDPLRKAPKSFIVDSRGCMGEGHWLQKSDRWYCKVMTVLPDGKKVSATHVYRPLDANRYAFQSINRTLDGEVQPDTQEVTVSRTTTTEAKN